MEGITLIQRKNPTIGSEQLIIGVTWEGRRICVDAKTGGVKFYPVIGFNKDELIFGKPIFDSNSFHEFISKLQYEPEESDNNMLKRNIRVRKNYILKIPTNKLSSEDWFRI